MNNLSITTYSGFSRVSGSISPNEFFHLIRGSAYEHLIRKINRLAEEGKPQEAVNVKRQLPFFTITANYAEKRLPESLTGYNDLITIDIDGLSDEQVAALRPLIEQEPATVAAFLTARRHGYKIIAYLGSETITCERLEENLYIYFRPAKPGDYMVKWKPAAVILSHLSGMGRTQANAQSQQLLI